MGADVTHIRTENGTLTLITTRAALDEIEAAMTTHDDGTEMYGSGSTYAITYTDGRKVTIRPAAPEEISASREVEDTDAEILATLTPAMKRTLANVQNRAGLYRWNVGSGGPAGALKRRGLIEYRTDRSHLAWYFTETAIRIGTRLAKPQLASVLGPTPEKTLPDA